jgi:nucleoside 2-deoxyribosyltransferase
MPFSEAYDDQYYLAVYPAVHESDHFCIRLDQAESAFTGNILSEIKEQIDAAEMVIALLDSANPNVYLEVGYAWGKGIPTVLCIHENENVPFDVRGERLIVYKHIYKLKQDLSQELQMVLKRRKRH